VSAKHGQTKGIFGRLGEIFFGTRSRAATQYLTSLNTTDDPLALARSRAESATALMRDVVVQETFQRMNEQIVAEIVTSANADDHERTVLFLKLQLVSELQNTLMTFVNDFETMLVMREADMRREQEEAA
jgi:hypothetical protein